MSQPIETCSDRETRSWWVASEGWAREAVGYRCQPSNPDYWWFPSLGYSIEQSNLFENEKEALAKAIEQAQNKRDAWQASLNRDQSRYNALP